MNLADLIADTDPEKWEATPPPTREELLKLKETLLEEKPETPPWAGVQGPKMAKEYRITQAEISSLHEYTVDYEKIVPGYGILSLLQKKGAPVLGEFKLEPNLKYEWFATICQKTGDHIYRVRKNK